MLALCIAVAALFMVRHANIPAVAADTGQVSGRDRLLWTALAAIPAGLVIAVTSYVTTDIAAAPFLWVLPLALYLLTFVAVFRDRAWLSQATVVRLVPILVAPLAIALLGGDRRFWLAMVIVNLLAFLLLALLCHGELYRRRPVPARLTEFYFCLSLGGALGGVFNALLAPMLFSSTYEYPLALILCCALRAVAGPAKKPRSKQDSPGARSTTSGRATSGFCRSSSASWASSSSSPSRRRTSPSPAPVRF